MAVMAETLRRFDKAEWAPRRVRGLIQRVSPSPGRNFRPVGIDLAHESVRARVVEHASTRRFPNRPFVVVPDAAFMTEYEAEDLLVSARWPHPRELVIRGILQDCYRASDGMAGYSADSVKQELEWRRTASWLARFKRAMGALLSNL